MTEFQNTIDLLGDDVVMKALLANTLTEFHDDAVTTIRDRAFYNCLKLKSIIAPNATGVGSSAFYNAGLETADLPNVTTIDDSGFYGCKQLRTINIPLAEHIEDRVFQGCTALAALDLPNVTTVFNSAFQDCKALVSVNLPRATRIDNKAFYGCTSLVSVNIPSFSPPTNPTSLFYGCSSLPNVDLPQGITKVVTTMFKGCTVLKTLILRRESICTLSATDAFDGTPFASGGTGGKVLVPRALIESYETATNWSTLYAAGTCTFLALEDYTVDGTITGEIDWASMSVARSLVHGTIRSIDSETITSVGQHAFNDCDNLTSASLPNATSVGKYAFNGCGKLVSVDMPRVETIGMSAFYQCWALIRVDLPSCTLVDQNGFNSCQVMKEINLPVVEKIDGNGFTNCKALQAVRLPATPPDVKSNSFLRVNSACVFYVPTGSLAAYQAHSDWSAFTTTYSFVEEDRA
jgi:hypothetical protein